MPQGVHAAIDPPDGNSFLPRHRKDGAVVATLTSSPAGTDILDGDPLGYLKVSMAGVAKRDETVWRWALDRRIPIVHMLSGAQLPSRCCRMCSYP